MDTNLNSRLEDSLSDIEAEQCILGALLIKGDDAMPILSSQGITKDMFSLDKHESIFSVLNRIIVESSYIDLVIVAQDIFSEGLFDSLAECREYVRLLSDKFITLDTLPTHCKIIKNKFRLRKLLDISQFIETEIAEGGRDSDEILNSVEDKIASLQKGRDEQKLTPIYDIVFDVVDHISKIDGPDKELYLGLKSGFTYVDRLTTGLNKSDLIIIGARPGMGKTSFAINIMMHVAKTNPQKNIAFFSIEMSKEQIVSCLLSSHSLVESQKFRVGNLSFDDWDKVGSSATVLKKLPIYIDDSGGITVPQMKAKLKKMHNLGLVIIDYLQLMSSTIRTDNRAVAVGEITRQVKIMAKELDVPVILLSQLSRNPEGKNDKRPVISDLRDSGSIEQDADIVMLLYRESYYNKEIEDHAKSECIIAKNRHGETGTAELRWDGTHTRFSDLEKIPD